MEKKLSVEKCIAFNKCIKLNPVLFKKFINDLMELETNRFGYLDDTNTKPSSSFYGLYIGTYVNTIHEGIKWYEIRNKYQGLSNISNPIELNELKNGLIRENGNFKKDAIDFIFKYDMFLEQLYRTRNYYNDTLLKVLYDGFLEEYELYQGYFDYVISHMDKLDEINNMLNNMFKHEIYQLTFEDDVKLTLK